MCGGSPREVGTVLSRNANRKSITADAVRANNFALKLDTPENGVDGEQGWEGEGRGGPALEEEKVTWDRGSLCTYRLISRSRKL